MQLINLSKQRKITPLNQKVTLIFFLLLLQFGSTFSLEEIQGEDEYEVEDIVDKKIEKGKPVYLVKWKGFSLDDATWEPLQNLANSSKIIKNFESKHENDDKSSTKSHLKDSKDNEKKASSLLSQSKKIQKRRIEQTEGKKPGRKPGSKSSKQPDVGNLDHDTPSKLTDHGLFNGNSVVKVNPNTNFKNIYFLVEFKKRGDGSQPDSAYYPFNLLKAQCPEILLDYITNMKYAD